MNILPITQLSYEFEHGAIGLYQATNFEADINTDFRYSLDDAKSNAGFNGANTFRWTTSTHNFPMPITISEIIAAEKTDDFCRTVFATMGSANSFFLEGKDGVHRLYNHSIP